MPPAEQWLFAPFRLDPATGGLWRDDTLMPLRPKALAVLVYLVAHAGEVVGKDALVEAVWPETVVSEGVLKTCMAQIRRVLGDTAHTPRYIATVHRRGYRFIAPVTPLTTSAPTAAAASEVSPPPLLPEPFAVHSPIIGREAELARLHEHFARASQGQRQLVWITGEPGIGKTTLVDAFVSQVTSRRRLWHAQGQCTDQYGASEAYLPLLEVLGRLGRSEARGQVVEVLRQQAPTWLTLLPALGSPQDRAQAEQFQGAATRQRMLRELAEAVEALTLDQPLILVLEDLHWSDVSTVDWLGYVARRRGVARLLILGTYRLGDTIIQEHPLHRVAQELQRQGQSTELALTYFTEREIEAYLQQRFASGLRLESLARQLCQRTNGNPLFLVTMVEALAQAGILRAGESPESFSGEFDANEIETPESIRALIDHQLGLLGAQDRELLEVASVAGQSFSAPSVAACVSGDIEAVESGLDTLARRRQFIETRETEVWPDGTLAVGYTFIHALYQEVIYSQVPASRKVRWHHQIGVYKETGYAQHTGDIAAELSAHFLRARDGRRAVGYLRQAGANAMRRHAYHDAIGLLRQGLHALELIPDAPERLELEVALLLPLGAALIAANGYAAPEVETTYLRARHVCEHLGASPRLPQVLLGLHAYYCVRGAFETATELGEQCVSLTRGGDPVSRLQAHYALGTALLLRGQLTRAQDHLEQGIALYRPAYHQPRAVQDAGVTCLAYVSGALWTRGAVDQALSRSHDAVVLAQELSHPFSLAHALYFLALVHLYRGEWPQAQDRIAASLSLAKAHGLTHWLAVGTMLEGRLHMELGDAERGLMQLSQASTAYRSSGAAMGQTLHLFWIAESQAKVGQPELGLQTLGQALEAVQHTDERWCEAELYRMQGEYVMRIPATDRAFDAATLAETHFVTALTIARRQYATSWELRAATSLARLWQHQDKRAEARELLAPVYGRFTEGFDTADLQAAKALLEALG